MHLLTYCVKTCPNDIINLSLFADNVCWMRRVSRVSAPKGSILSISYRCYLHNDITDIDVSLLFVSKINVPQMIAFLTSKVLIFCFVDSYRDIDSYVTILPSLPT